MTNGERADRRVGEARQIAREMNAALDGEAWNLATRRAQEALELAIMALLNEMSVDYPKTHDPAPVFAQAVRMRGRRYSAPHLLDDIPTHPDRFDAESGEANYRQPLALAELCGMRPLVAHCHLASASWPGARANASRRSNTSPPRPRCTARWPCASGSMRPGRNWPRSGEACQQRSRGRTERPQRTSGAERAELS